MIFKICDLKKPRFTKNQKNHNLDEKRQSIDVNIMKSQILALSDKNFKEAIIKKVSTNKYKFS